MDSVGLNSDEAVYSGQAATLGNYEEFSKYFSVYRAHPLLFQFIVSLIYNFTGVIDVVGRLVSAIFGILTVLVIYLTGKLLYNRKVALAAAFVLAIIPYHVLVTRQAMVDIPFSFFFTLALFFMAKYIADKKKNTENSHKNNNNRVWIYAIGMASGMSFLSKEIGVLTLITSIIYMQMTRNLGMKNLIVLIFTFLLTISPHFILLLINSEASQNAFLYTQWQLSRPSNHPMTFYLTTLVASLGYVLSGLVILAIIYAFKTREGKTSSLLLITWISISFVFFQSFPTKGFHYLLALIPAFVLLGTSFLFSKWMKKLPYYKICCIILISLIFFSTNYVTSYLFPSKEFGYLAGSGGLPKAREAAQWIEQNTPEGSVFMTIGPTMGNIIKFYSNQDTLALSVNPNPAKHNPSYAPIINPDSMIKNGQIHYLVYDIYSATRSEHFADKLKFYVNKYNAELIHGQYKTYTNFDGQIVTQPLVMVYVINDIRAGG